MTHVYLLLIGSVLLGYFLIARTQKYAQYYFKPLLTFSGGFLLSLIIFHVLPHIYSDGFTSRRVGFFIISGMLLQLFLEIYSKGIEHGHIHNRDNHKISITPIIVSLGLHALLESAPLGTNSFDILYGILLHKVPVSMLFGSILINSDMPKKSMWLFMGIFAILSPIGLFLSEHWLTNEQLFSDLLALSVGSLLHLSTVIIFESSQGHTLSIKRIITILAGVGLAVLTTSE